MSCERRATARVIALLAEVDSRKLYAGQSCSSLFTYCVQVLHLSEHAAYLRIEAARLVRRFPAILDKVSDGSLHLTAVSLLGPHLTSANHVELIDEARHKTKREVEQLIAHLRPQPDVPAVVRKLPAPKPAPVPDFDVPPSGVPALGADLRAAVAHTAAPVMCPQVSPRRPEIKPLAPQRYKLQCTLSHETHDKLRRAQDLLRHTILSGIPSRGAVRRRRRNIREESRAAMSRA